MRVGLLPMGGRAERWAPLPTPKELLPFGKTPDGRPKLVLDHALEAMVDAAVERLVLPINPAKASAVMQYVGGSLANGALVCCIPATGTTMVANLNACYELVAGHDIAFAMPDTVFGPRNILRTCVQSLAGDAELVLGVFESMQPEELDLVDHLDGSALRVLPKPRLVDRPGLTDVWGVAAWRPSFTEAMFRAAEASDNSLGAVFQSVIAAGRSRVGVVAGSHYADLGSYVRYRAAMAASLRDDQVDPQLGVVT